MKLDKEPRLNGVTATVMEWARKVAQAVNLNDDAVQLGAWTSAPLAGVKAETGTITSASGTIRYRKQGHTVMFTLTIFITNNGTGGTWVLATLPFPSAAETVFTGLEVLSIGVVLQGYVDASSDELSIQNFDGSYPGANGVQLVVAGVYESTI